MGGNLHKYGQKIRATLSKLLRALKASCWWRNRPAPGPTRSALLGHHSVPTPATFQHSQRSHSLDIANIAVITLSLYFLPMVQTIVATLRALAVLAYLYRGSKSNTTAIILRRQDVDEYSLEYLHIDLGTSLGTVHHDYASISYLWGVLMDQVAYKIHLFYTEFLSWHRRVYPRSRFNSLDICIDR